MELSRLSIQNCVHTKSYRPQLRLKCFLSTCRLSYWVHVGLKGGGVGCRFLMTEWKQLFLIGCICLKSISIIDPNTAPAVSNLTQSTINIIIVWLGLVIEHNNYYWAYTKIFSINTMECLIIYNDKVIILHYTVGSEILFGWLCNLFTK